MYLTEFPDYDGTMPDVPGFTDQSWHNDICPKLMNADESVIIWCDYVNPELREMQAKYRFNVVSAGCSLFLSTDSESELIEFCKLLTRS